MYIYIRVSYIFLVWLTYYLLLLLTWKILLKCNFGKCVSRQVLESEIEDSGS